MYKIRKKSGSQHTQLFNCTEPCVQDPVAARQVAFSDERSFTHIYI